MRSPLDHGSTKLCRWLDERGLHGPTDDERNVAAQCIAHSAMCQFRANSYHTQLAPMIPRIQLGVELPESLQIRVKLIFEPQLT